jgi:hypothetical protein
MMTRLVALYRFWPVVPAPVQAPRASDRGSRLGFPGSFSGQPR